MRIKFFITFSLLLGAGFQFSFAQKMENKLDSMSYALGLDLGKNLSKLDLKLNSEMVYKGMTDVLNEQETLISEADVRTWLQTFQREAQAAQQRAQAAQFEEVKAEGELFLAENKKRAEVKTTASGLQYEVLKEGTGPKPPAATSTVKVHYEGRLIDESVFDSSYERGEPTQFPLNRVIPGWTEGLQLMNVGSKYRLYIPYDLGYGQRGGGEKIPPYSALVFDVELLEIVE